MKKHLILLLFLSILIGCNSDTEATYIQPEAIFYKGMDLSFQPELEQYNVTYKDADGNPIDLLPFVAENGTNLVRLKLWHTSKDGQNSLNDVKAYAKRVKAQDMAFLLNFHYSDYWADPGKQNPPEAWKNMTNQEIRVAIYNYTKNVLEELKSQNTLPEIIQIGNETDSGFLWNYGKVWNAFDNNWDNYVALVKEAIRAVREVDFNNIKIMLHHSSVENAVYFFDKLAPYNIDFDMIGLSYYPQFQIKNLDLVQLKLNQLALNFKKDILMVEVAYPFTLEWNDGSNNYIGNDSQILKEFPATPEGQKTYFNWLIDAIKNIPENRGVGFCYWAPDWVAFNGNSNTSTQGSAWENQCMFNFKHNALPVFDSFKNN